MVLLLLWSLLDPRFRPLLLKFMFIWVHLETLLIKGFAVHYVEMHLHIISPGVKKCLANAEDIVPST